MIHKCRSLMDRYTPWKSLPRCVLNVKECDILVFGSLASKLVPLNVWPGCPDEIASRSTRSVAELAMEIQYFKYHTYPSSRENPRTSHHACGFTKAFAQEVQQLSSTMASGMQESHRTHMATQRTKLSQSNRLLG